MKKQKFLKIKRIDRDLPLPEYKTDGSVAFDFFIREKTIVLAKEIKYIALNVCIQIPKGFTLLMAPRSSMHKRGLTLANSVAVFDEDFCGDGDEYHAAVFNFTEKDVTLEKGDRLTQGFLFPTTKAKWKEVAYMKNKDRGGFGSTGCGLKKNEK